MQRLLIALLCVAAALPPLPGVVPVRKPRLSSPKEAAFRGNAVPMAIPPRVLTNYGYADFPSPRDSLVEWSNGVPVATNVFTFTNLMIVAEVKTNEGPWFVKWSKPWPLEGGRLWVTNVAPVGALIQFRTHYYFIMP